MKRISILFFLLSAGIFVYSQQPLPRSIYSTLRDSTNALDIVLLLGKGGSMSLEGRNVQLFNTFFDPVTAPKTKAPQAGTIMWLINGREFISGNFYLGDSTGYVVFKKEDKEYVNRINTQGNAFLKSQIKY
ncbi:MAG: hypothetical protein NZM35_01835 [Chitinophagales bacterium]|nr:hypothetical protein [Chitinophagales bacterium]MDW8418438.1 hypothetical protein [Chitinophagales bacterium]